MPGAQGANHKIECFRQSLLKLAKASTALEERDSDRNEAQERSNQNGKRHGPQTPVDYIRGNQKTEHAHGQHAAHGPLEIGLCEQAAQPRPQLEVEEPLVEPWNGAELIALAKVENLIPRFTTFRSQGGVKRGNDLFGLTISACG